MKLPSIRELIIDNTIRLNTLVEEVTKLKTRVFGLEGNTRSLERKIDGIDERTKFFPKLYDNVDKLLGEIEENRQERAFTSQRVDDHEQRLEVLEKHL